MKPDHHYRPEIDGLRAIAVAAVILFHAGLPGLGGGFVGVDVFFVISGFLITAIIRRDVTAGRFSVARFYERRVRRILPALFVVMAACIPPALLVLSPDDLKDFAQSLAAVSLCGSNVLFWGESGYFDTQAELKPLLHTWSLAVEEQFYIAYPPLVLLASRFGLAGLLAALVVLAAGSLAVSVHEVAAFPSAAFYLLPSRAWELAVGGIAAVVAESSWGRRNVGGTASSVAGWCGLASITFALAWYGEQTPFPGLAAIPPVLGTALVLLGARSDNVLGRMLSWRPLVGLGLVSYSAYLWHQPLFAFTRHFLLADLSPLLAAGLCAITLMLAVLTWKFVEQPFRDRATVPRVAVLGLAAAGFVSLLGLGLVGHRFSDRITELRLRGVDPSLRSGFQTRAELVADRNTFARGFLPEADAPFSGAAGIRRILLLGDSLSEDLYAAVAVQPELFPGAEFRRLMLDDPCMEACARLVETGRLPAAIDERICRKSLERIRDTTLLAEADMIVLCANWPRYITHATHEGAMTLAETLARQGRDVRIVGLFTIQEASSIAFLAVARGLDAERANHAAYVAVQRPKIESPNAAARELAGRLPNVRYLDKEAVFCDEDRRTVLLYGPDGRLLFADNFHLTADGGRYFGRAIADRGWFDAL